MQVPGAGWTGKHHKNEFPWDNCPLFTFNCSSPSRGEVEYDFSRHA